MKHKLDPNINSREQGDEKKKFILTIDVERLGGYGEEGVYRFLKILSEYQIKATFFITGDFLENCFDAVKAIKEEGHEIASHGFSHPTNKTINKYRFISHLDSEEVEEEINRSKQMFADRKIDVKGFRAPFFKIRHENLDIIGRHFFYDSSVCNFIFSFDRYTNIAKTVTKIGTVIELPVSSLNIVKIPLGTPAFFAPGINLLEKAIKVFGTQNPLIFYCHVFDLVDLNIAELNISRWKKKWYYSKCGPLQTEFFESFLSHLKSNDTTFLRCIDFVEEFKLGKRN